MIMRAFVLRVTALMLLCFINGVGWADGLLLAPSAWLSHFSEQAQLAVVEVRPDASVKVELAISLRDESNEPHTVHFLLPLQTLPGLFEAEEMTMGAFAEERLDPLDGTLRAGLGGGRRHREAVRSEMDQTAFLAGPVAAAWALRSSDAIYAAGTPGDSLGLAPSAITTVETEHARAHVYDALDPEQVGLLSGLPAIPDVVRDTLSDYAGRPFALVELRTIPIRLNEGEESEASTPRTSEQPGVVFTFTQEMEGRDGARCYDYPLGTGEGWQNPIGITQVYVTAPSNLLLEVEFPDRSRGDASLDGKGGLPRGKKSSASAYEHRQVHFAEYWHENPNRDVRVSFHGEGETEFARIQRDRERRLSTAWIFYPLLAILTWLVAVRLVVFPHHGKGKESFWVLAGGSWLVAYFFALGPILLLWRSAFRYPWDDPPGILSWLVPRDGVLAFLVTARADLESVLWLMVLLLVPVLLLGGVAVIWWASRSSSRLSFIVRSGLSAALAGATYLVIGRLSLYWLAP